MVRFKDEGLDELRDVQAYPKSLFKAQLQLRLYGGYMSASSETLENPAELANDRNDDTIWESGPFDKEEWLMLDFGIEKHVDSVLVNETSERIDGYALEFWDGTAWKRIESGNGMGTDKHIVFTPVSTRKLRLKMSA